MTSDNDRSQPLIGNWPREHASVQPVSLTSVEVHGFLGRYVELNSRVSLPKITETVLAFRLEELAAGRKPDVGFKLAVDSDVYKWMEGASYALAVDPKNNGLRQILDRLIDLTLAHQDSDGYLNTQPPEDMSRFDTRLWHDLYMAGHFFEAAVAHDRATGERRLLEAACRWADFLLREFEAKNPYFDQVGENEHPEIELALIRLYRATGDRRYLDFAATIAEMNTVSDRVSALHCGVGKRHAVRVGYLLSALAELYMETGEERFSKHLQSLWDDLISNRCYITGGIGCNEIIPEAPYDLPQIGRIAETCASIALIFFGWRMHGMQADSRLYDVIETILYNHLLGALSLDQLAVFYYNPIRQVSPAGGAAGAGPSARTRLPELHGCSCCFPNVWRFLAALPEYLFSHDGDGVFVNLYTTSRMRHTLRDGAQLTLNVQTDYPHDGRVEVAVELDRPAQFNVRLRIPEWCREAELTVNGEWLPSIQEGAYCEIDREWRSGDEVVLTLSMPAVMISSSPNIHDNLGQAAFRRGPLVYCLEEEDTGEIDLERVAIAVSPEGVADRVQVEWQPALLGGVHVLRVPVTTLPIADAPYFEAYRDTTPRRPRLMFVPFYARANRSENSHWLTLVPMAFPADR